MSSTSGFVGQFLGSPHAGGGVGGFDTYESDAWTLAFNFGPVALINGTPTLVPAITIPNDNVLHLLLITCTVDVTTTETGGAVQVVVTQPNGHTITTNLQAGGTGGPGLGVGTPIFLVVPGGTTIQVNQSSALTVGNASVSGRILVN